MKKLLWIIIWIIALFTLWNNTAFADGGFWISDWVSGIDVPKTDDQNVDDEALHIVVKVVDRILSLVSLIAIIVFMIWWYKVITAWWDDSKVKSWYKFIKNAIIWILIIWLTRAIVRLIFRFVGWMDWDWNFDTSWGGGWWGWQWQAPANPGNEA